MKQNAFDNLICSLSYVSIWTVKHKIYSHSVIIKLTTLWTLSFRYNICSLHCFCVWDSAIIVCHALQHLLLCCSCVYARLSSANSHFEPNRFRSIGTSVIINWIFAYCYCNVLNSKQYCNNVFVRKAGLCENT